MLKNKFKINVSNSYKELPKSLYKISKPSPMSEPEFTLFNHQLANDLGLDGGNLKKEGLALFSGQHFLEDGMYIAQAYAGHQFGHFTILGDGRAILVAEHLTPQNKIVDIQLKGAGKTIYSRGGDGLAPLHSVLKEYILSEAMHGLRIPTTRSLAVVQSNDPVLRDRRLKRGILTRIASSHLRVGTFQYAMAQGNLSDLVELTNYAINRHFPELYEHDEPYLSFFKAVIDLQAKLIAHWQSIGFVHGVMNTDNMTISGETIDYGPCAFLNQFKPQTAFSSIDISGRYVYENQPIIGQWNVTRFAETLLPLIGKDTDEAAKLLKVEIEKFLPLINNYWTDLMRSKLGLTLAHSNDTAFFNDFLKILKEHQLDYTNTFVQLTERNLNQNLLQNNLFNNWYKQWLSRIEAEKITTDELNTRMRHANPILIPRHHLVENAINQAIDGHFSELYTLIEQLKNPFAYSDAQKEIYQQPVPKNNFITYCGT